MVANLPDCSKAAAAVNHLLDVNQDLIAAIRSDWSERNAEQVGDRVAKDVQRVREAVTTCEGNSEFSAALARFRRTPEPPTDDALMAKFVALYDHITDAAVAAAPDCKRIAAAIGHVIDNNRQVIIDINLAAGGPSRDAVAHLTASHARLDAGVGACTQDGAVQAALGRLAIQ